ncbi:MULTISPECIES: hypothetical protein [Chitinophagaceae]
MCWKIAGKIPTTEDNFQKIGIAGPVTGMLDSNTFLLGGGANFPEKKPWMGGTKKYYKNIFVLDVKDSTVQYTDKTISLPFNVAYCAVTTTSQGVFYAGGENEHGILNNSFLIKKATTEIIVERMPDLPIALTNASITTKANKVYVIGGESTAHVSSCVFVLDLNNPKKGWGSLAALPHPASNGALVAVTDGLFYIGGRCKRKNGISELYSNVYFYSFSANTWYERQRLPYPLSAGPGAVYRDGHIILLGGDRGEWFHKTELLAQKIALEKDAAARDAIVLEKATLQERHPGFSNEILSYSIAADRWLPIGHIPFPTPCTTSLTEKGNKIFAPSGEIRAGVRTPDILLLELKNK